MKVDLSILVLFSNQDSFIEPLLNSLLEIRAKHSHKVEILVALDKPSDYAISISQKFNRDQVKFFFLNSDPNSVPLCRAAQNRYFLLNQAMGKYAITLDGDDYYVDTFDKAIDFLDENPQFSGYAYRYYVKPVGQEAYSWDPEFPDGCRLSLKDYLVHNKYVTSSNCIVFRREKVVDPKDSKILSRLFNDVFFSFYLLTKGDIHFSHEKIMVYRVGINSTFSGASLAVRLCTRLLLTNEIYNNAPQKMRMLAWKKVAFVVNSIKYSDIKKLSKGPNEYVNYANEHNLCYLKYFIRVLNNEGWSRLVSYILFRLRCKLRSFIYKYLSFVFK